MENKEQSNQVVVCFFDNQKIPRPLNLFYFSEI